MMVSGFSRRHILRLWGSSLVLPVTGCASTLDGSTSPDRTPTTNESRPLDSCPVYDQPYPDEWAMFGYDARNTGANPGTTGPADDVTELWRFETGSWVECSPAVAADTIYITSRDRNVYALSTSEGTERWRFETGISETDSEDTFPSEEPMRSSPTVVDGTVYVGGGNYELRQEEAVIERVTNHNYLYALDSETGDLEWRFQPEGVIESSPTVVGGIAYFGCNAGNVYAVDTSDGGERWRFTVDGTSEREVTATPAVSDCRVFVGSWDETLYALDARDGSVVWRHEAAGPVSASPAVGDGTVYVGINGNGGVLALSTEDGEVVWEYPTQGSIVGSSPAIADGTVYIGDYSDQGERLHAIDARSGEAVWSERTRGYIWSSPAVVDGTVYVSDLRNMVYGFDARDGTRLWEFETGDNVRPSPAVADGTVYLGSDDGNVYAVTE